MPSSFVKSTAIFDSLVAERQEHDPIVDDVQQLLLPYRGDVTSEWDANNDRTAPTFDATGVVALHALASYLQGSIFSPNDAWLRLRASGIEETAEVRAALDMAAMLIMDELDNSNFYVAMHVWLKDLCAIGNACLFMEEGPAPTIRDTGGVFGGLVFESIPYAKVWRRLDRMGRVLALGREFKLDPLEVEEFFGKKLSGIEAMLSEPVTFRNLVVREDGVLRSYWWKKGAGTYFVPPKEVDYRPYFPGVWDKVDGQAYGYGQGHLVRPCVAGMQELARETIQAVGRDLNPLLMVEHDSFMNMDVAQNGMVTLKRSITRDPQFLSSGSNFAAADQIRRLDKEQVEKAFFADALFPPDTQERSAEATRARQALLAIRMAGPAQNIALHLSEIVGGIVELMGARGALPMLEGIPVRPTFVSPFFANAKLAVVERTTTFVAQQAQLAALLQDPAMMDKIDLDKAAQLVSDLSDIPGEIIRSQQEVLGIREERLAAQQAAIEAEQAPATAVGPENTELELGSRNLPGL